MQQYRVWIAACAIALLGMAPPALGQAAKKPQVPGGAPTGGPLDRVRMTGQLKLGYRTDARPLSFKDESGKPAGFSVDLCTVIADQLKAERGHGTLAVEWVPLEAAERFAAVEQGRVDILCGADTPTLARRAEVSFSIPIFPGGIGALIRADAAGRLKDALDGKKLATQPNWRANAAQALQSQRFAVMTGTNAETWLGGKLKQFELNSKVVPVESYDAGVQRVLDRKAEVFFGDRALVLDAARRNKASDKLMVLDRLFTTEALALTLPRGDEDFRLFVDKALSGFYASGSVKATYAKWFGGPSESVSNFYGWVTLPN